MKLLFLSFFFFLRVLSDVFLLLLLHEVLSEFEMIIFLLLVSNCFTIYDPLRINCQEGKKNIHYL